MRRPRGAGRAEGKVAVSKLDHGTSVFLATLAHELRTPLNTMLWWVRLLRDGALDDVTRGRALDALERNLTGQARLIEDFFDLSSILTGKVRLHSRSIDLAPVIEAAIDAVYFEAHVKGLRLDSTLPARPVTVMGDPDRLQQVAANLLLNAIKFSPQGARVEIRLESVRSEARIIVIDNGRGISRDLLPSIFERFRQVDPGTARFGGGLGLGLAIARDLVEMHGGHLTADSPGIGRGATFTVSLPHAAVAEAEPPKLGRTTLAGLHVLLVGHSATSRQSLTAALERCAASVTPVTSTSEVLKALDLSEPDVLVIDMAGRTKSGHGLIQAVRRLEPGRGGRIPGVALTAHGRAAQDRIALMAAGFQACVSKPVVEDELIEAIVDVVRGAGTAPTSP